MGVYSGIKVQSCCCSSGANSFPAGPLGGLVCSAAKTPWLSEHPLSFWHHVMFLAHSLFMMAQLWNESFLRSPASFHFETQCLETVSECWLSSPLLGHHCSALRSGRAGYFMHVYLSTCVHTCMLSCVWLFATPWTVTQQAPLFMEFSRQEHWSGLPFPSPRHLPNPGIKPVSLCFLHWQADSLPLVAPEKVKVKSLSHVQLFVTPWTVAHQASPSMGFSRQECWSGLPFPSPGDLPYPGIEPRSPALKADALPSEPPGSLF